MVEEEVEVVVVEVVVVEDLVVVVLEVVVVVLAVVDVVVVAGGNGGHFTEAPDTMVMFCPPMSSPLTKPGLSATFRSGTSSVPSTLALQHPLPPPPPVNATCAPLPMML